MQNPLVSILIPAYKAKFLKESISSALMQTYTNIEVVVVNDDSPEQIDEIVNSFADSRLRYYKNTVNIGGKDPVANWNHCLSLAKGDYFSILCDDDLYEPDFVNSLIGLANKYSKCCVFRARARKIDAYGNTIDFYPACPEWENAADYLIDLEGRYRYQTISEFLFKKNYVCSLGGFSPFPKAWLADYQSVVKFGAENGIVSCCDILVSFRVSGLNISSQENKNILDKVVAENFYSRWLNDFSKSLDKDRRAVLLLHRKLREEFQKTIYIAYAGWKDLFFLWKNRNSDDYKISSNLFFIGLGRKLVILTKKLIGRPV